MPFADANFREPPGGVSATAVATRFAAPAAASLAASAAAAVALAVIATAAGAGVAALSARSWYAGLAAAGAAPAVALIALRPRWGLRLFVLGVVVLAEFPSGYGETVERSQRTAFYSKSLGIPGFYSTDAGLLVLAAALALSRMIRQVPLGLKVDSNGVALGAIACMLVLSTTISLVAAEPASASASVELTGTEQAVNERAARLIPFFQMKAFGCLFAAYALGVAYMTSAARVREVAATVFAGLVVSAGVGAVRLCTHPSWVTSDIPLFYDSPDSWLFIAFICYAVLALTHGLFAGRRAAGMAMLAGLLGLFVLVSFRRTMWGASVAASPLVLAFAPAGARFRLALLACGAAAVLAAVALLAPVENPLTHAVLARAQHTSVEDPSTLYRLALFHHFARHWHEVPAFGYGARPLWDLVVSLDDFRLNLENVHSLYFWFFLRTGPVGLALCAACVSVIAAKTIRAARRAQDPENRVLLVCVLIGGFMFLFSGLFNPVYGEVRYTILLGLGLAMASRVDTARRGAAVAEAPAVTAVTGEAPEVPAQLETP